MLWNQVEWDHMFKENFELVEVGLVDPFFASAVHLGL